MSRIIKIGTRGSKLALWQANTVADALRRAHSDLSVEIIIIKTTGDAVLDTPLAEIGDKGLFTKELERALLDNHVDVCVHSMKDVPSQLPAGCALAGMLERAHVYDVLILPEGATYASLDDMPQGSRIGTGSLRRVAQMHAQWPHLTCTPIRGNVDTRIAKLDAGEYDGIILASAGVERMGLKERISYAIDTEYMVPAVGQGAIGLEIREGDEAIQQLLASITDNETNVCVEAERRVLAALEGGCQVPMGAYAVFDEGRMMLDAIVLSVDGSDAIRACLVQEPDETPLELAHRVVALLEEQGARELLAERAHEG